MEGLTGMGSRPPGELLGSLCEKKRRQQQQKGT